jgi:hypothetical protein
MCAGIRALHTSWSTLDSNISADKERLDPAEIAEMVGLSAKEVSHLLGTSDGGATSTASSAAVRHISDVLAKLSAFCHPVDSRSLPGQASRNVVSDDIDAWLEALVSLLRGQLNNAESALADSLELLPALLDEAAKGDAPGDSVRDALQQLPGVQAVAEEAERCLPGAV